MQLLSNRYVSLVAIHGVLVTAFLPFVNGCETMETCDTFQDPQCIDNCPDSFNPDQSDRDGDGAGDACDACPDDPNKTAPGGCGCGISDADANHNGIPDCHDLADSVTLLVRLLRLGNPAPDGVVRVATNDRGCLDVVCQGVSNLNGELLCPGIATGQELCIEASCCDGARHGSFVTVADQGGSMMIVTISLQRDGACCYSDGGCATGDGQYCSGTFVGEDTSCDSNPCPPPGQGGCCFPGLGVCYVIDPASCAGNYLGDGTPCTFQNCPQPTMGACCTSQGCITTTQLGCDGIYLGDGTTCGSDPCS